MDQKRIGQFIADLRKQKNMTQAEVAAQLGVTDRAVSKWENGRGMPDPSYMLPLCDLLGITVNELLSGEKIADHADYQAKADENFKYMITDPVKLSNVRLLSILCAISGLFTLIWEIRLTDNNFGKMLCGICGIVALTSGLLSYLNVRKVIPESEFRINYFIHKKTEKADRITLEKIKEIGIFEMYGTDGYRGWSSRSLDEITDYIQKTCNLSKTDFEVFTSPVHLPGAGTVWSHSDEYETVTSDKE
ncbi:MAG: helix-turn-helix domain-containing protein [Solobacterium sp.]|nr:helix-turn-helix domain-containing protein [Solobacterium sp.]